MADVFISHAREDRERVAVTFARMADWPRSRRLAGMAVTAGIVVLAAACSSGGGDGETRVLEAGQVDAKVPAGYQVVGNEATTARRRASPTPR